MEKWSIGKKTPNGRLSGMSTNMEAKGEVIKIDQEGSVRGVRISTVSSRQFRNEVCEGGMIKGDRFGQV